MSTVTLSRNGATRTIPTGYSWTTFFFGPLPSLVRFHWPFFWKVIAIEVAALLTSFLLADIFVCFLFACCLVANSRNESLLNSLLKDGWKPEDKPVDFVELPAAPDAVNDEGY